MKSGRQNVCTNCKSVLKQQHVFQGVIVCEDCFKMVSHTIEKTKKELSMLFLVYTDIVRAALVKGEFRPPTMPPDGRMAPSELSKALQQVGQRRHDASKTTEESGRGSVHPLRSNEN